MYSMGPEVAAATFIPPVNFVAPSSVDWRKKGAVTPVKNQGHYGSCWSFSADRYPAVPVGTEPYRLFKGLRESRLQRRLDASMYMHAFRYIKDNGGIDTEKTYPYEAVNKQCRYERKKSGAFDVGLVDLPKENENTLKLAIATVGPVSVAIDASHVSFQQYSDGVHVNNKCSTSKLNHAVLVVGYGTDKKGGDYWLVKNSWSKSWGENGYIRMARNRRNNCGIASQTSYPLV